jgi:hypothetical protein
VLSAPLDQRLAPGLIGSAGVPENSTYFRLQTTVALFTEHMPGTWEIWFCDRKRLSEEHSETDENYLPFMP